MYNGEKFMTRGVSADIGLALQLILWKLTEDIKTQVSEVDYLQVFKLTVETLDNGKQIQVVKHTQEVPPYSKVHKFNIENPVTEKVFVIHSSSEIEGSYSTMLLAEEY